MLKRLVLKCSVAQRSGVLVRKPCQRGDVAQEEEGGVLATLHTTILRGQAHGSGGVEGDGIESLFGGETHLRAGQRPDKLHVARRRGAWVVVGGEGDGQASVDVINSLFFSVFLN